MVIIVVKKYIINQIIRSTNILNPIKIHGICVTLTNLIFVKFSKIFKVKH